jgi:folate-binding protein YgfZ
VRVACAALLDRSGAGTYIADRLLRENRVLIELPAQLLELSGPDCIAFAQAQFSSDLRTLHTGSWQWSAWLSAQGRVRCWFALLRLADDRLLLWLRGGEAIALRADLVRFVFRSKVKLTALEVPVYGADAPTTTKAVGVAPSTHTLVQHAGVAALCLPDGERYVLIALDTRLDIADNGAAVAQWRLDDIRAGLPELAPALRDRFLPQWLGLDRLGAVSVGKGCYPGQEIMARLHFKGGNKRGLYRIACGTPAPPEPGTELRRADPDAEAGTILISATTAAAHAEALATLIDDAAGLPLRAAATPLQDIEVISRFS